MTETATNEAVKYIDDLNEILPKEEGEREFDDLMKKLTAAQKELPKDIQQKSWFEIDESSKDKLRTSGALVGTTPEIKINKF